MILNKNKCKFTKNGLIELIQFYKRTDYSNNTENKNLIFINIYNIFEF